MNPVHYFEEEITDYENGCSYFGSVEHGLEGTLVGALDVTGIGEEAVGAEVVVDAVAEAGEDAGPSFIGFTDSPPAVVPDGATGPGQPLRGSGMTFEGGSGGNGLDPSTTGVRIMDEPSRTVYMNKEGQTVNPYTGRTIEPQDPWAHLP